MDRRQFLRYGGMLAAVTSFSGVRANPDQTSSIQITAKPGQTKLVGPDFPATPVWGFDGQVPGVPLKIKQGESLNVAIRNGLDVPTSVHWHGIRLPNAMDGVAGVTQKAILPGDVFHYKFTPPDAGTYWYHSHVNSHEQVGRGLYGPLIIEETDPPLVDRDLIWMIDDWRLQEDATIVENFGMRHDRFHGGRLGNVPTVNARYRDVVSVKRGERIRLRLINTSNARNFSLSFGDLEPSVIAIDGQPVIPRTTRDPIVIGVAGRVDLILDMTGDALTELVVTDHFYREAYDLVTLVYEEEPLRENLLDQPITLKPNDLPEPDLQSALKKEVVMAGGAMGGLRRAKMDDQWMDLREIARQGFGWAMNDVIGNKMKMPPLLDVTQGTSIVLTLNNETAFPHPMHLHGHHMKLLSVDDKPLAKPYWVDSPLLMPEQRMQLAFVADNPGDWLFHCHILEHHLAGMGTLIRVRA